jgi:hypothetical protein
MVGIVADLLVASFVDNCLLAYSSVDEVVWGGGLFGGHCEYFEVVRLLAVTLEIRDLKLYFVDVVESEFNLL